MQAPCKGYVVGVMPLQKNPDKMCVDGDRALWVGSLAILASNSVWLHLLEH